MKKKWGLVILLAVFSLLLTACGGSGGIEGVWRLTSGAGGDGTTDVAANTKALLDQGGSITCVFHNGMMTVTQIVDKDTFYTGAETYTVNGNTLEFGSHGYSFTPNDYEYTFSIQGNTLTLTVENGLITYTFVRE